MHVDRHRQLTTDEDYLAFERSSPIRHEFHDGQLVAMSGASEAHNLICGNLFAALHGALRGHACRVFSHDMRVKPSATKSYVYPDIVIACPPITYLDDNRDTLLNPRVVIEVLSPSTESYDRSAKFDLYREASSLQQYVLISQDAARAVSYIKQSAGIAWTMMPLDRSDSMLELPEFAIQVPFAELYRDVAFPTQLA